LINDVGVLGALAAWRVTQGIYRFDPDVYDAVIQTPITGDLPHDVFFGLPEWCVYVETPGLTVFNRETAGFFAFLEYDTGDGRKELRLVLDCLPENLSEGYKPSLMSAVMHLGSWSLQESIEKTAQESRRQAESLKMDFDAPPESTAYLETGFTPLISLLLYICSANSEIGDGGRKPARPKSKKTKKGIRIFPAPKVSVWDVGVRMGAVLRREKVQAQKGAQGTTEKQRSSPRPHVRRAHWHGYWSGPRNGEQRFTLRWMPPLLVRREGGEELPVTIKPVK
jgi:hypothetical protein